MGRPRKKEAPPAPPQSVVPEVVRNARAYKRQRVNSRQLPTFQEAMLLLHAPEVLRTYWEGILEAMRRGDKWAYEQAAEIHTYIKSKGINLSLTQQMMNNHVAAGETAPVIGYDALVRQIAEARAQRAIPAPAEVIDIEPVAAPVNVEA